MNYLTKRGAVYWLKRRVPADIQPLLPPRSRSWVQESLNTSSDKEARKLRDIRLTELNAGWESLRRANNLPAKYLNQSELRDANRHKQELHTIPVDSVEREEQFGIIEGLTKDIHINEVVDPFKRGNKGGDFLGIAIGEAVFVKEATDEFLANTRLKPSTTKLYKSVLGQVAECLPYVNEVSRDAAHAFLQAYASTRTMSAVNNLLSAVKALWRYLGLEVGVWEDHRFEAGRNTKREGVYSSKD